MRNSSRVINLLALLGFAFTASTTAVAADPADRPYLGWSSWSLQATTAPGYGHDWLTADRVLAQADAMKRELGPHGFTYVNIDSFWSDRADDHGRPIANPKTFPDGIAALAARLHANGQKLGLYLIPGVSDAVYDQNPLIAGLTVRVRDILFTPRRQANAFGGHAIDFAKPGAQAYVDSIAQQLADWGVDFLKLDGMVPGSDYGKADVDSRPDAAAWARAIKKTNRPIWLTLSWSLDRNHVDVWRATADAWRVNGDVERYGPTLSGWEQIRRRFDAQPAWHDVFGVGRGWGDLDSLPVASGDLDGLTPDEKRTAVTFWAVCCSPLYVGGDLTKLDNVGRELLTNDRVIAIAQAGMPARQIVVGDTPIWSSEQADGSTVVALFNLTDRPRRVGFTLSALGLKTGERVRDVWTDAALDPIAGSLELPIADHACRVLRLNGSRTH